DRHALPRLVRTLAARSGHGERPDAAARPRSHRRRPRRRGARHGGDGDRGARRDPRWRGGRPSRPARRLGRLQCRGGVLGGRAAARRLRLGVVPAVVPDLRRAGRGAARPGDDRPRGAAAGDGASPGTPGRGGTASGPGSPARHPGDARHRAAARRTRARGAGGGAVRDHPEAPAAHRRHEPRRGRPHPADRLPGGSCEPATTPRRRREGPGGPRRGRDRDGLAVPRASARRARRDARLGVLHRDHQCPAVDAHARLLHERGPARADRADTVRVRRGQPRRLHAVRHGLVRPATHLVRRRDARLTRGVRGAGHAGVAVGGARCRGPRRAHQRPRRRSAGDPHHRGHSRRRPRPGPRHPERDPARRSGADRRSAGCARRRCGAARRRRGPRGPRRRDGGRRAVRPGLPRPRAARRRRALPPPDRGRV
ncbi:MAG: hypothetical protein AVDCRST_MAG54-3463, partial [uncultured Actinomycetospora sp.]